MLRKKFREEVIDSSYNKYSIDEEEYTNLPSWFVEDERKFNYIQLPITKQEVEEQK